MLKLPKANFEKLMKRMEAIHSAAVLDFERKRRGRLEAEVGRLTTDPELKCTQSSDGHHHHLMCFECKHKFGPVDLRALAKLV